MKRIFTLLISVASAGVLLTACHSDTKAPATPAEQQKVVINQSDTVGLAALKAAKAEEAGKQAAIVNTPQKDTVVIIKEVPKTTTKTRTVYKNNPQGSYSSNGEYAAKEPATTITTTQKKKGWSKAAKGTAIGAGTGAVIGGIAGKGKGAIIGGIIGGATGYGVGRHKDKKDGRIQ